MSDISSLLHITSDSIKNIVNSGTSGIGKSGDSSAIDGIYNAAVNMITETNDYIHDAEQAEVDFATGRLTSTHELAVIEQKANLSFQYTVAVKNQLLSANEEIMNVQI